MINISVFDFILFLYLALLLGSVIPLLMHKWESGKSLDAWFDDPQNRGFLRAEAIIFLPFFGALAPFIFMGSLALFGVTLWTDRRKKRRK